MFNDGDDDEDFQEKKSKSQRRKERRMTNYFSADGRNFNIGRPQESKTFSDEEDLSDLEDDDLNIENKILESPSVWNMFAFIGNANESIDKLLLEYHIYPSSDCDELKILITRFSSVSNFQWNDAFDCDKNLKELSIKCGRELKFVSIIPNFTPRDYGRGAELFFVHVRFDQYFLAEKSPRSNISINIPEYFGFLGEKPTHVPISLPSDDVRDNRENFIRIMKIVEGKNKKDTFQVNDQEEDNMGDHKPYYDPLTKEDLGPKRCNIFRCKLFLEDNFSGYGKILDEKYLDKKIFLHNRRNCFQAFNQDIVDILVFSGKDSKSNNKRQNMETGNTEIWSGRVLSVERSEVKPVNKIFLCKLAYGQANFMIPICETITTIEVDNNDAKELVKNNYYNLIDGLRDVSGIENLIQRTVKPDQCKSFADKSFVTLKTLNEKLETTFDRIQYVDCYRCDFIFLVIYREWSNKRRFPNGEVVGLYTPDVSFTKTLPLIAVTCDLSVVSIEEEKVLISEVSKIEQKTRNCHDSKGKSNESKKTVFSFKYKNQPFNEVAYSYESLSEESFRLGMHVVNVEKYIKKGDFLDKIAMKKFFTFLLPVTHKSTYNDKPFYLLSEKLTNDILTLNTMRSIDVISFYFKVSQKTFIIEDNPQMVFEDIVLNEEINVKQLVTKRKTEIYLRSIYETCIKHRIDRIKSHNMSYYWFYPDYSLKMDMEGFLISEEMEVITNKFVASLLSSRSDIFFPVKIEDKVLHNKSLQDWMDIVRGKCCLEFFPTLKKWFGDKPIATKNPIRLSEQFLKNILKNNTINYLKCDMLFPDVSFYSNLLDNIVERTSLIPRQEAAHTPFKVSITRPLQCFTDIVLQRLNKIVFQKGRDIELYTEYEIDDICSLYNYTKIGFDKYRNICNGYEFNDKRRGESFILDCVFEGFTDSAIIFQHAFLREIFHDNFILFEALGLAEVTLPSHTGISFPVLDWETKIFVYNCEPCNQYVKTPFRLDDIYLYETPPWRNKFISSGINKDDTKKLNELLAKRKYSSEMTSETSHNMDPKIKLSIKLQERQILRIQFSYDYTLGIMKIIPELLVVNPRLQLCLCHRKDPFKYFIHPNVLARINYKRFTDLNEYKDQFRVLNRIEGIYQTIREETNYFIHDVKIIWIGCKKIDETFRHTSPSDDVYGVIILDKPWCAERFIKLGHKNLRIQDPVNTLKKAVQHCHMEFIVCLQSFMASKGLFWIGHAQVSDVAYIGDKEKPNVHLTLKLTHSNFPIKPTPDQLYSLEIMETPITARVMDRSLRKLTSNSLIETIVLNKIGDSEFEYRDNIDFDNEIRNNFIKEKQSYQLNAAQRRALNIAIHRDFSLIWGPPGTGKTLVGCIIAFAFTLINKQTPNERKPAVLYCGPSNQSVDVVAEKLMSTFGENCPQLVRIFNTDIVNVDFPYPAATIHGETFPTPESLKPIALHHIVRKDGKQYSKKLKKYTDYLKSKQDRSNEDRRIYSKKVIKYRNMLELAFTEELQTGGYEIVLCTTVGSCRKYLSKVPFSQVIIDEACMCTEPEILGPILDRQSLKNTVLIGDHMQLRPIVTSEAAKGKQFNRSLFERIYESGRVYTTMLDTQYRMHPSICEFPSQFFYKSENTRLITDRSESWSGLPASWNANSAKYNGLQYFGIEKKDKDYYERIRTRNDVTIADKMWKGIRKKDFLCYPVNLNFNFIIQEKILFIDCEGHEKNQTVSGSTGNIKSKGNEQEVLVVGRLYEKLIENMQTKTKANHSILVITQYRLQEHMLKKRCSESLQKFKINGHPNVSTVVKSQGSEADYVIFSTVRSLPHRKDIDTNPSPGWISKYLGCITDKNQFNVAITRAKKGLFIIGNKNLLSVNHNWKNLIDDLQSRGCIANNICDVV